MFFLGFCNFASGQSNTYNPKLTIRFSHVSIEKALTRLETERNILLSFDPSIIPKRDITLSFVDKPLLEILDSVFNGTVLSYKHINSELVIVKDLQKLVTLSGHIRDRDNGEDLIGASIYTSTINQSGTSNNYGFYSITIPKGNYELLVSHIGYKNSRITVHPGNQNIKHDVFLEKQRISLNEVSINSATGNNDSASTLKPEETMQVDEFKKLPYYKGEADVIKALQMQSGIVGMTEGSSSLFVRGGNRDQNLVLMDEAIVYNPAHLFGLTSIFNPDAIKNIQVYKDGIPANYGGRLSSVIETRMADGNDKNFHINGGLSLLSARIAAEVPLVKDKASFLITYRKSLTNLLNKNFQLFNLNANYYDVNFKVNYRINQSNRIFYSAYLGSDHLYSTNSYLNNWGNQTSTLRWNHLFNSKLFSNLSLIYSNYSNQLDINADSVKGKYKWQTGIKDATLKGDFIFYPKPGNELKFGFSGILHLFIPGESTSKDITANTPRAKAGEYAFYISNKTIIGGHVQILAGLRASIFQNIAIDRLFTLNDLYNNVNTQSNVSDFYNTFFRLEPRLLFQYQADRNNIMQLVYNRTYQYLQLIQNDELAYSSLETWIPASPNIAPQQADMFSLKFQKKIHLFSINLSGYYKKLNHQLDLIDHAQIILNPVIESQLRPGKSDAYGTELVISKPEGKITGTLAYTFSRVFRQINNINNGIRYPANYDVPHDLKLTISYNIADRLSFTTFFTYASGRPVTLPVGYYIQNGTKVPIFEGRNISRFPDYNRLDVNVELKPKLINLEKRHWFGTWNFGLYNLYGQKNPLFYNISQNATIDNLGYAQSFSGIVPTISYNFRF